MLDTIKNAVAKRHFMIIDNEPTILGKYGRVSEVDSTPADNKLDVWLIGLERQPLTGNRLAKLYDTFNAFQITKLDGEAHFRATTEEILPHLKALGLAPRIIISDERKAEMSERMKAMHKQ